MTSYTIKQKKQHNNHNKSINSLEHVLLSKVNISQEQGNVLIFQGTAQVNTEKDTTVILQIIDDVTQRIVSESEPQTLNKYTTILPMLLSTEGSEFIKEHNHNVILKSQNEINISSSDQSIIIFAIYK